MGKDLFYCLLGPDQFSFNLLVCIFSFVTFKSDSVHESMLYFTLGMKSEFFDEMRIIKFFDRQFINQFNVDWEIDFIEYLLELFSMFFI